MSERGRARNAIQKREEQVKKYRVGFRARVSRLRCAPLTNVIYRVRFGQSQRPSCRRTLRYHRHETVTENSSKVTEDYYR